MDAAAIPFMTVAELSQVLESREVSPVEVTQAYLDRIGQVDDKLHAYITVCADEALGSGAGRGTCNIGRGLPWSDARDSGGGQGPDQDQGHIDHLGFKDPGGTTCPMRTPR